MYKMKKIFSVPLIPLVLLFLFSCSKGDYSLRFTNNYTETIYNAAAGSAFFGNVDPGKTSDYKILSTKSFLISGTSTTGKQVNGSEAVSGKGTHKWTITLTAKGEIVFTEDKI